MTEAKKEDPEQDFELEELLEIDFGDDLPPIPNIIRECQYQPQNVGARLVSCPEWMYNAYYGEGGACRRECPKLSSWGQAARPSNPAESLVDALERERAAGTHPLPPVRVRDVRGTRRG
ncbi:hypothetical protein A2Y99_03615 [Candidatus Gottesmanbacteria bacterium RBG_13_37_7]|uniref:Uncharacterized protein n=1 Tax=Candidatus Gottesmanbacteria bacterium RBG_13_37_7 TaxID=1798369 RepID=A0A1F5YJ11_9BACT|nr:MAG: hypothetical protein A2Y99_03615 [Candidatus Gottesmanbacteria bacterium RBG_13_37_7]